MNEMMESHDSNQPVKLTAHTPRIVLVGVGGAGCNCVHRVFHLGIKDITTIAINTDRIHLEMVDADRKLLIGNDRVHGTGTGSCVEVGRECMEDAFDDLVHLMGNPDVVFVVSGLGGGTGTGAGPVAAAAAKECGAIVVGVAFMPFRAEGRRINVAKMGLEEFRREGDAVMVIENDRLLTMAPSLPLDEAFLAVDRIVMEKISGMFEMMSLSSKILETSRIIDALPLEGLAMVVCGENITCESVNHPLLEPEYAEAAGMVMPGRNLPELMTVVSSGNPGNMPRTNVLVGTRSVPEGGRRVVPLVAGMRNYAMMLEGPKAPEIVFALGPRGPRQVMLLGGPWAKDNH